MDKDRKEIISLDQAPTGVKLVVSDIEPRGAGATARLLDMGLIPGTELEVVAVHPFKGPVVIRMQGTEIAVGRGIARRVKVALAEPYISDSNIENGIR